VTLGARERGHSRFSRWPGLLVGMAIQMQSNWCAGLSCLSYSSNQINQKNQIDEMNQIDQIDQIDQLPTTRREMVYGAGSWWSLLERINH